MDPGPGHISSYQPARDIMPLRSPEEVRMKTDSTQAFQTYTLNIHAEFPSTGDLSMRRTNRQLDAFFCACDLKMVASQSEYQGKDGRRLFELAAKFTLNSNLKSLLQTCGDCGLEKFCNV